MQEVFAGLDLWISYFCSNLHANKFWPRDHYCALVVRALLCTQYENYWIMQVLDLASSLPWWRLTNDTAAIPMLAVENFRVDTLVAVFIWNAESANTRNGPKCARPFPLFGGGFWARD